MAEINVTQSSIVRTSWGLTIEGTRITLYDVMDYITDNWPPEDIRAWLRLTDKQITDALDYIKDHRKEVEAEYQQVLEEAEKNRQYWEEYNREHLAKIRALPPKPGQEEIKAKLKATRAKLGMEISTV